jgi:hypothetical protein
MPWVDVPCGTTRSCRDLAAFGGKANVSQRSSCHASPIEIDRDRVAAAHQDADALARLRRIALAFLAARTAGVPLVTIRSTLRRTSSATKSGNRSARPSAERYSMMRFCPRRSRVPAGLVARRQGWRRSAPRRSVPAFRCATPCPAAAHMPRTAMRLPHHQGM